jgi:hypothetical protein
MTEFKHLYDLQLPEKQLGCICGRHRSPLEHEREARLLQCVSIASEPRRYDGLLAAEALRGNFRKG